MSSKWVRVGSVRRFDWVEADTMAAAAVNDAGLEVIYSLNDWRSNTSTRHRERLLSDCADVIQATLNLVVALGVDDFRPWMKACERRNRERGRITDGWSE